MSRSLPLQFARGGGGGGGGGGDGVDLPSTPIQRRSTPPRQYRKSFGTSSTTSSPSNSDTTVSKAAAAAAATTTTTSPSSGSGTTIRRLSDDDVRSIFECLHHQAPLPSRLSFTIVQVGPNGLKLSPPSYEFQDGLYVLLRPPKKVKAGQMGEMPRAPPHLQHLVMDQSQWEETCPWSLSGPQFPQPTAIQQRYCYPKGEPEYSSRVGGALWTMYSADTGKEDLEFRLLHVYYSAKRAVNKGIVSQHAASQQKQHRTPSQQRRTHIKWEHNQQRQQQPQQLMTPQRMTPKSHPSTPFSAVTGICHSPLTLDWSSPSSISIAPTQQSQHHYHPQQPHLNHPGANWVVTPQVNDLFRRRRNHLPPPSTPGSSTFSTPSPIRKRARTSYDDVDGAMQHPQLCSTKSLDALDMESSLQDIDSYWNDPLMSILMQPSADGGLPTTPLAATSSSLSEGASDAPKCLCSRLSALHEKLREIVSDDVEAASLVKDWAENLATEFQDKVQQV